MQDLKVGHLLGATPWKQQLMLLIGALAASAVVPLMLQLLFQAYGIGGVVATPGMPVDQTLPAPPAAVMAMLARQIFHGQLGGFYFGVGGLYVLILWGIKWFLARYKISLSLLAMALGIYLPMTTSTALFLGGFLAWLTVRNIPQDEANFAKSKIQQQRGYLIACGVVVGAILLDLIFAIATAAGPGNALQINTQIWAIPSEVLGILALILLGRSWLKRIRDEK